MTTNVSAALAAAFARIREITETPEYQANAARLAAEAKADEERQAEARFRDRLRSTGVPEEVTTKAPHPTPASAAVAGLVEGPPAFRFLMLSGDKGNGKTFALASAVWKHGGRYIDAHQLVATSTWDTATLGDLEHCRLLAIDEMGAEFTNPAFEANLYALLDRRYRAGRKTVLATNLNAADFKARFCEHGLDRLVDRLKTGGRWVTLAGPSMRRHWSEEAHP